MGIIKPLSAVVADENAHPSQSKSIHAKVGSHPQIPAKPQNNRVFSSYARFHDRVEYDTFFLMAGTGIVQYLPEAGQDDHAWLERCRFWAQPTPEKRRRGAPPRRVHRPLILTGNGMRLNVDQGTLLVRQGFTHYPQKQDLFRFFPGDRNLPSRIIVVDGSGSVTFDVISWLSQQNVPLVRIDWRGNATTVISNSYGPDPQLVRTQLAAVENKHTRLKIATALITEKLKNSVETLTDLEHSVRVNDAVVKHEASLAELKTSPPKTINALLGIEGRCALAYFNAWQDLPLRWNGTSRKPIPNDWLKFTNRTSVQIKRAQNRNASHPVNSMLNYAYAVLESRMRLEIVALGYDPMIGFLHSYNQDRAAFVFDLMEPLRPVSDHIVLDFIRTEIFHPADFTIRRDGVCRLNPELAKEIVRRLENYPFSINLLLQRSFPPTRIQQ
jgi:CRISPR-associated protein Cas1